MAARASETTAALPARLPASVRAPPPDNISTLCETSQGRPEALVTPATAGVCLPAPG